MNNNSKIQANTLIGIVVIIVGALYLARNFGFFPEEYLNLIFRWQSFALIIGAIVYFTSNNRSVGLTIFIIGVLGILPNIWPIIFIAIGGYMIYNNSNKNSVNIGDATFTEEKTANQTITDTSIFGGGKKTFHVDNFAGGNITAIFGGSEINLMDSTLADGTNKLELLFLFGGSSIVLPRDWNVSIQTISIFGGFKDKRVIQQNSNIDSNKQLIITGLILFGGGDIKNW